MRVQLTVVRINVIHQCLYSINLHRFGNVMSEIAVTVVSDRRCSCSTARRFENAIWTTELRAFKLIFYSNAHLK